MKTKYTILILAGVAGVSVPVANAQLNGTLRSAGGASSALGSSALPDAGPRAPIEAQGRGAAGAGSDAVLGPVTNGTRANGDAGAGVVVPSDQPTPRLPRAGTEINAGARGDTVVRNGAAQNAQGGFIAGGISAGLDSEQTLSALRESSIEQRDATLEAVHTRFDQSAAAAAQLRESGAQLQGDARARFKTAWKDVRSSERSLKRSLKAAQRADAEGWVEARERLATDYDAYAAAVSRAEVAAASNRADTSANAGARESIRAQAAQPRS